jgi:hypothetical protein
VLRAIAERISHDWCMGNNMLRRAECSIFLDDIIGHNDKMRLQMYMVESRIVITIVMCFLSGFITIVELWDFYR